MVYKYVLVLTDRFISVDTEKWLHAFMNDIAGDLVLMSVPWMKSSVICGNLGQSTKEAKQVALRLLSYDERLKDEDPDWFVQFSVLRKYAERLGFYGSEDSFKRVMPWLLEKNKLLKVYLI